MNVGLIYARARNGVIGKGGALPWRLPEDMAHFKQVTLGCTVIMGRKTWDSLPPRFRPLPGRQNIVVTRQANWSDAGASRASSLVEALALCRDQPQVWVIGGAEIYAQAVPLAHTIEVTEIDADFDGDVFAPSLGPEWAPARRESHHSSSGVGYSFVTYIHSGRGA